MKSLYKSEKGKKAILDIYDKKLEALNIQTESMTIQTSFGDTHILISGDENKPPIIVVHGSNGCAPLAFETYPNLTEEYRVYAVDVLAQPNKSAETRLSMKDDSYGRWINEIINHFNMDQVSMAGFSFGGLIILKTLEYDERKIKEVFLSAPAYIVNGNPLKALFMIFIPMRRYMKTKNARYVEKFLAEVFTERDEFAIEFLSKVFLEFEMDFTPVPVIKGKAARKITTPINIFAAKNDVLFPGNKMRKRAQRIFPSLNYIDVLDDSKHVQSKSQNLQIEEFILNKLR